MTDSTIERAKFTNGTVLVPVCIQGTKHELPERDVDDANQKHALIEHFPCFIARDGKSNDDKPLLCSRATPGESERIFYGICKQKTRVGLHDRRYAAAQMTRADVVVRGVYDAPQKWLWTPKWINTNPAMNNVVKRSNDFNNEKRDGYIDFDDLQTAGEAQQGFVPYTSNTGIVLYNMRPNGEPGFGYPFCVSRMDAMMLIKNDMEANTEPEQRQFITLGQFFGHVTDWDYVRKHTDENGVFVSGDITAKMHRDICRGRVQAASANTPKTRRSDRRTFKVFFRT